MLSPMGKYQINIWDKEKNCYVQKYIRLEIDLAKLADHIGWRAHTSKSGKSKFVQGYIVATKVEVGGPVTLTKVAS